MGGPCRGSAVQVRAATVTSTPHAHAPAHRQGAGAAPAGLLAQSNEMELCRALSRPLCRGDSVGGACSPFSVSRSPGCARTGVVPTEEGAAGALWPSPLSVLP